jgi:RB1-inducible coiled-coil protein 1
MCVGTSEADLCETATSMEIVATCDMEVVTDDNMGTGLEVDRLRQLLVLMHRASQESIALLRQQISTLKTDTMQEKQALQSELDVLLRSWDELKAETKNHERELVQRLTVDHELEMNDLRKSLYVKDDEINTLKSEKQLLEDQAAERHQTLHDEKLQLERRIQELEQKVQNMEKRITQQTIDRETAVKEVREKMLSDHRNEIESLRCKFKLMTSMERSPSDTSLEKIEQTSLTSRPTRRSSTR